MKACFPPGLALICLSLAAPSEGQVLVGVGVDGAYEIDVLTGSTNHVLNMMGIEGATDAGAENLVYARTPLLDLLLLVNLDSWSFQALGSMAGGVRELAFDEARRELWATSSSSLIRVDPITGHTVTVGALYSTNPWVTLGELRGLDYDVARDRLVGTDSISLWAIDKTSGACAWIGAHNAPGLEDIHCDPASGIYWGVSGPASELLELDPISGLATHKIWLDEGPFNGLAAHAPRDTGTAYCVASPNSSGQQAETLAYGFGLVSSGRILLATEGLPPGQPALLIASQAWSFLPPVPGTMGYQCVIGNLAVFRDSVSFADNTGRVMHDVDLTAMPTRPTSTSVQPGETWHFQAWYRDNLGGSTTNFSLPTRIDFQ
jgi:hypothetical protein